MVVVGATVVVVGATVVVVGAAVVVVGADVVVVGLVDVVVVVAPLFGCPFPVRSDANRSGSLCCDARAPAVETPTLNTIAVTTT